MSSEPYSVPRPFASSPWRGATREAAEALWAWHLALWHTGGMDGDAAARAGEDVASESPVKGLDRDLVRTAYDTCRAFDLPRELLASQVRARPHLDTPARFATASDVRTFSDAWAGAHGRLLAHLAGIRGRWQLEYVDELAYAFFLTGRLVMLADDARHDRVFFGMDDLHAAGVAVDELRHGVPTPAVRRLLWKQVVRVRDAYAHASPLARELPRWTAWVFKTWWLGGLEMLNEIERRDYDVWSEPVSLRGVQRLRVRLQALVGRTTFSKR